MQSVAEEVVGLLRNIGVSLEKVTTTLGKIQNHNATQWKSGEAILRDVIREHEELLAAVRDREIKALEDDEKPTMKIMLRGGGEVTGYYQHACEEGGRILWIVLYDPDGDTNYRVPPDVVGVAVIHRSGEKKERHAWERIGS